MTKIAVIITDTTNTHNFYYDCRGFVDEPFSEHRGTETVVMLEFITFSFLSRFNRPIAISPPWSFLINRSEPKPES